MSEAQWLTLQDYSNKYRVSISTLRRRIKSREMEYIFKNGKYLLRPSSLDKTFESLDQQTSFKELKQLYQERFEEQEKHIEKLNTEIEDLNQLVLFLEREKDRLEEIYKESSFGSPEL